MTLGISEFLFFAIVFLSVSLWEYITFQRNAGTYPYREGFAIFSIIQWIGVFLGMVGIFGTLWGLVISAFCMFLLQYISHFSIGMFWNKLALKDHLFPTKIFAVTVWAILAFGIYHFI